VRRWVLAAVVVLAALATACTSVDRVADALSPSPSAATTKPGATGPTSPSGATVPAGKPAIAVETPRSGDELVSPIGISGRARTQSGTLVVEILGADGRELAAVSVDTSCGAGCRGEFSANLAFFVETRESGTVRVFEPSAEDGTALHTTEVAITLVPGV
jgi:hypothetical protein